MKKKVTSIFTALMAVVLCTVLLAQPAFAFKVATPEATVPVTINLSGPLPSKPEDFEIKLERLNPANPMPEGLEVVDDMCAITIPGYANENGSAFPTIKYDKVGIYDYKIWQTKGDNSDCAYDDTVYYMRVYITNNEALTALEATVLVYKSEDFEGEKTDVKFNNKYKSYPPDPDPDEEDGEKPPKKPKPEKPEKPSVDTSDNSNVVEYLLAAGACTAVLAGLFFTRKKNESEE